MMVEISGEDREAILLALAQLALRRPHADAMLRHCADSPLFDAFKVSGGEPGLLDERAALNLLAQLYERDAIHVSQRRTVQRFLSDRAIEIPGDTL